MLLIYQPSRPLINLGRKPCFFAHDHILSNFVVSGNPGAVQCSFCHGTGKNPGKTYPPSFGLERTYDNPPCDICGDRDNHYHKKCPSCNGKGYVERLKR